MEVELGVCWRARCLILFGLSTVVVGRPLPHYFDAPGSGARFAEFLAGTDALQVLKCYLHDFGCRMLVHFMAML
jgi:hypothetical protein